MRKANSLATTSGNLEAVPSIQLPADDIGHRRKQFAIRINGQNVKKWRSGADERGRPKTLARSLGLFTRMSRSTGSEA